jgi:hypothetical protein
MLIVAGPVLPKTSPAPLVYCEFEWTIEALERPNVAFPPVPIWTTPELSEP